MQEWATLAVRYRSVCSEQSRQALLLDLLAERCDASTLAQLADYFGADLMEAAVARSTPALSTELSVALASRALAGTSTSPVLRQAMAAANSSPTIDYTLHEIYLSYRTAPVGAMSVKAALYESAMFVSKRLTQTFGIGYAVGTVIAPMVQIYAPGLWDTIGAAVYNVVNFLSVAPNPNAQAHWQQQGTQVFGLTQNESTTLRSYGGDYSVVFEWYSITTGCGFRLPCAPIMVP